MAVPDFIITALANIDHFREEAQLGSPSMCHLSPFHQKPRKLLLRSRKILWKMNPNWTIHFRITNPSLHSNSIGLQTILVIWSLTHREGVVLHSLYFTPILFAIPGDWTPNLTTILITTDHYTPYPKYRPWSRLSHSLMAVHLMFTSWQTLHYAYHTAMHLGASCISSLLYDPYLHLMLIPCTPHDLPSSYRVWSTYLGYAPHAFLMYYSTGYL